MVFWFVVIFIGLLIVKLTLHILETTADKPISSELVKYINFRRKISETVHNYLSVNQIISLTSLVLYLRYEYFEKSCFNL